MSDYSPPTYSRPPNDGSSAADSAASAKQKATDAAQAGKQAASEVAQTAADSAKDVAQQTASHAKDLAGKTSQQVTEQADVQKSALVDGLRSLVQQLDGMTKNAETDGIAVEVTNKVRAQADSAANWLDGRDPGEVLDGIRGFGRERPAAYLAGALAAGVVAGRLTRGVVAVHTDGSNDGSVSGTDDSAGKHEIQPQPSNVSSGSAGRRTDTGVPATGGLYGDAGINARTGPGSTR